jgi:hypothetical protein
MDTDISVHLFYMELILNHELLTQYTYPLCEMFSPEKNIYSNTTQKLKIFSIPSHVLLFRISSL